MASDGGRPRAPAPAGTRPGFRSTPVTVRGPAAEAGTRAALIRIIDAWATRTVVAGAYLEGLYRTLDDGRQAALAIQAQGHCGERVRRRGLQAALARGQAEFRASQPDATAGEQEAWQRLVLAQAILVAFHALLDGPAQADALRGQRTATRKALDKALAGYRSAFPEEITRPGIRRALAEAVSRAVEAFLGPGAAAADTDREGLERTLRSTFRTALAAWAPEPPAPPAAGTA